MPQSLSAEISMDSKVCRLSSDSGKAVKLGRALNRLSTRNRSSTRVEQHRKYRQKRVCHMAFKGDKMWPKLCRAGS